MSFEPTLDIRMFERLPVLFRSAMYALRGGFLIRPLAIAMILGLRAQCFRRWKKKQFPRLAPGSRAPFSLRTRIQAWRR